ncbi:MAG: hypothetical protein OXG23_07060 [Chloroflexi bacterium]|nr:hypothetical protein [Chloroflexota bacterium]MCY3977843.1 hypothetical protein [Chloroflexota bacterium]MDE2636423.1 hypothetical protein [Chloroflexota bacterium]
MSLEIDFDLRVEGEALADPFLDRYELELMFEGARQSIGAGLKRKFADVVCAEHGEAPRFTISGVYDNAIEEMDIQYHVDTCCQRFLLRVMQILNQRA